MAELNGKPNEEGDMSDNPLSDRVDNLRATGQRETRPMPTGALDRETHTDAPIRISARDLLPATGAPPVDASEAAAVAEGFSTLVAEAFGKFRAESSNNGGDHVETLTLQSGDRLSVIVRRRPNAQEADLFAAEISVTDMKDGRPRESCTFVQPLGEGELVRVRPEGDITENVETSIAWQNAIGDNNPRYRYYDIPPQLEPQPLGPVDSNQLDKLDAVMKNCQQAPLAGS